MKTATTPEKNARTPHIRAQGEGVDTWNGERTDGREGFEFLMYRKHTAGTTQQLTGVSFGVALFSCSVDLLQVAALRRCAILLVPVVLRELSQVTHTFLLLTPLWTAGHS